METSKAPIQSAEQEVPVPETYLLGLPHTFPDTGFAYELLSVVEDHNDDCKMHVAIEDFFDNAESWGEYLADVARVIARDYAGCFETTRTDGDLFAAICDGFNERVRQPDTNQKPSRLDNPFGQFESSAFELFKNLCGQYEFLTPEARAQSRKVLAALLAFYDSDSDIYKAMLLMYDDALDDARTGRVDAELENLHRDVLAEQQADTTTAK